MHVPSRHSWLQRIPVLPPIYDAGFFGVQAFSRCRGSSCSRGVKGATFFSAPATGDAALIFGDAGFDAGSVGRRARSAASAIQDAARLRARRARRDAGRFALILPLDAGFYAAAD